MKKWLIIPIILLCMIGFVYSQEKATEKPIEPKIGDMQICFTYTLEDAKTAKDSLRKECRTYPSALTNTCVYDRYGKARWCNDITQEAIRDDIKKWYNERLPSKVSSSSILKDVTIVSTSAELSALNGKTWDFINEGFE